MSGTTTRNIGSAPVLSSPAGLTLLCSRGAGELVRLDPAATGGGSGSGTAGQSLLTGYGAPTSLMGNDGDKYIDLGSADRLLYGPKAGGAWPGNPVALRGPAGAPGESLAGSKILSGSRSPIPSDGVDGDYWIDKASYAVNLYGPKANGTWPSPIGLRGTDGTGSGTVGPKGDPGAAGANGASVLSGHGLPSNSLGANNDLYVDLDAAKLYGPKAGGVWPLSNPVSLQGPAGPKGADGTPGVSPPLSSVTPLGDTQGGAVGTGTTAARADHRHPPPTLADVGAAAAVHTHTIAAVSGLQTALDGKADAAHSHPISQVVGLQPALDAKVDKTAVGAASGVASLGADGKVPAAQLPTASGGGSSANLDNGTADGQIPVWNAALAKYQPETQQSIVRDRDPVVELNANTALTFNAHHRRIVVLSAAASLTFAVAEIGVAPYQGFTCVVENDHTAANTLTFAAGITVSQPAAGTGTGGAVKIAAGGQLSVLVYPKGSGFVAKCRGDVG